MGERKKSWDLLTRARRILFCNALGDDLLRWPRGHRRAAGALHAFRHLGFDLKFDFACRNRSRVGRFDFVAHHVADDGEGNLVAIDFAIDDLLRIDLLRP